MSASTVIPDAQRRGSYEALQLFAFWGLPVLLTSYVLYWCLTSHELAVDFHQEFWPAGHLVLQGTSPYTGTWQHISAGVAFPYPALTALGFAPFALLPHAVADLIFTAIDIAAVLLTLRALDVKDRRLYGLVLLWPMVIQAWQTANLTLLLGLGIAWVWRKRDNAMLAGVVVAVMISLKPFIWPIGLWLLVTRRYRAAAWAVAGGLTINLVSWTLIGFDQLHAYEQVVQSVTNVMYRRGYDATAVVMRLGSGHGVAYAAGVAACAVVGGAAFYAGRRNDGRSSLALCIALSLLATPVLWAHYFALMVVPVALARPRLSPIWFVPLLLWPCPVVKPGLWQSVLGLGVTIAILCVVAIRPDPTASRGERRSPAPGLPMLAAAAGD